MNDKQAVSNAKKKGASANRSTANAEQATNQIQDKIAKARRTVADATKAQIIGGGIADALSEIAQGDFGDLGEEISLTLDLFIEGVEEGVKTLEAAESDPKYLLPPSPLPFRSSDEEAIA